MEIVAQWLDDIEDLLVAAALLAEQGRCRCLQLGLAAALALQVILVTHWALEWAGLLAGIAAACVGFWCLAVLSSGALEADDKSAPA